tara:strand:- start:132 stop:368 length:237 start_codon:yes stop_codon:yes gene_type:complete
MPAPYTTYKEAEKAAKAYAAECNAARYPSPDYRPFKKGARKFDSKFVVYSSSSADPMVAELDLSTGHAWCVAKFRYAD